MMNGIDKIPVFTPVFKPQSKQDALKAAEEKAAREAEKKAQEEAERKQELARRESELSMLEMQLKSSDEQAEAAADSFEAFSKCLTIAQRITRGDKVPMQDIKYLMENEPDLYKQAIMMRQPNSKPKEYDTVLDEDDIEAQNDNPLSSNGTSESSAVTQQTPVQSTASAPAAEISVAE